MRVYENGARVLTNNPPFPYHMTRLNDFMALSPAQPQNSFAPELPLRPYGQGMGGIGLPGDASPSSRFVRAAFYAANSVCEEGEEVAQFFHVLGSVSMPRGGVRTPEGKTFTRRTDAGGRPPCAWCGRGRSFPSFPCPRGKTCCT